MSRDPVTQSPRHLDLDRQVDESLGLPVLVMLPGEDWSRGYAGRWQPHRLVDRGVVLVTVQSRVGALGAPSMVRSPQSGANPKIV